MNLTVASGAGQHLLQFPNARNFVLAGGNLGLCLCETLRDIINGTMQSPLRIRIVTDATYENMWSVLNTSNEELKRFLNPLRESASATLAEMRLLLPNLAFLNLVMERIASSTVLCPHQGSRLDLAAIRLKIKSGIESISVGSGSRIVILELVHGDDLFTCARSLPRGEKPSPNAVSSGR